MKRHVSAPPGKPSPIELPAYLGIDLDLERDLTSDSNSLKPSSREAPAAKPLTGSERRRRERDVRGDALRARRAVAEAAQAPAAEELEKMSKRGRRKEAVPSRYVKRGTLGAAAARSATLAHDAAWACSHERLFLCWLVERTARRRWWPTDGREPAVGRAEAARSKPS